MIIHLLHSHLAHWRGSSFKLKVDHRTSSNSSQYVLSDFDLILKLVSIGRNQNLVERLDTYNYQGPLVN